LDSFFKEKTVEKSTTESPEKRRGNAPEKAPAIAIKKYQ